MPVLTDLPSILIQEVLDHYNEINNVEDSLTNLHNGALKTLQLSHIVSKITLPMCDFVENRLAATINRIKELKLMEEQLLESTI